jgi:hypothetical protein
MYTAAVGAIAAANAFAVVLGLLPNDVQREGALVVLERARIALQNANEERLKTATT